MKKLLLLLLAAAAFSGAQAQTGISAAGTAPDAAAMMDVIATDKGFMVPRVALTALNAAGPVAGLSATSTSLLVYNTASAGIVPNDVTPGFYYWNNATTSWIRILSGAANLTAGNDIDFGTSATNSIDVEPILNFVHTISAPAANNLNLNAASGNAIIVNFNNGTTGATQTFRIGDGAGGADVFNVAANGNFYAANNGQVVGNLNLTGTTKTLFVAGIRGGNTFNTVAPTIANSNIMYADNASGAVYSLPAAAAVSTLTSNATGQLSWASSTGTGIQGYWNRTGTTLAPTNTNDLVSVPIDRTASFALTGDLTTAAAATGSRGGVAGLFDLGSGATVAEGYLGFNSNTGFPTLSTASNPVTAGVYGIYSGTTSDRYAVFGEVDNSDGTATTNKIAVYGRSNNASGNRIGVVGDAMNTGSGNSRAGVLGLSGAASVAISTNISGTSAAVMGISEGGDYSLFGYSPTSTAANPLFAVASDIGGAKTNKFLIGADGRITTSLTTAGIVTTTAAGVLGSTATVPVANGGTALSATPANGQLLIGNGTGYTLATLTGAGGITVTNASGAITLTGSGGTVTNFSAGDLTPLFTTTEATTTTTPALSFALTNAGAYTVFGNNTVAAAAPTYFTPTLASALFQNQGTTTTVLHGNAAGNPTWGSVAAADFASQTANTFLAAPNGSAGTPTFRTIVAADLPSLSGSYINNSTSAQASANFNIGAAGVIGTTLTVGGATTLSSTSLHSGLATFTAGITTTGVANLSFGADASAHSIFLGTGAAIKTITIGSTTSTSTTTINGGSGASAIALRTVSSYGFAIDGTTGTMTVTPSASGFTISTTGKLRTAGIDESSDIRWKKNINPIMGALEKVAAMRGVTYDWRREEYPESKFAEGKQYGLIAQELEKIVPELVHADDQGYKTIEYSHLVPVLIEAIKELNDKNVEQKAQLDNQQKTNSELKASIENLLTRMNALENNVEVKTNKAQK